MPATARAINYLRVYAIVAECMKQKSDILENVTLRIIEALYAISPAPPCPRDGIQPFPSRGKYARFP
ncbi:MAG: hypothetical protein ACLUZZ_04205 [Alistipes inops]